jgi:hypothetical protein
MLLSMLRWRPLIILVGTFSSLSSCLEPAIKRTYTIGATQDEFGHFFDINETVKLLSDEVGRLFEPQVEFEMVHTDMNSSSSSIKLLQSGDIDFIFSSSDRLACLSNVLNELVPIASMRHIISGEEVDHFGALIIVRNGSSLVHIQDLTDSVISIPALYDPTTHLLWQTMEDSGVRLLRDPRQLIIRTESPQEIVLDVLQGTADAGFIPAAFLGAMAAQMLADPRSLRILPPPMGGNSRLRRSSTQAFPGWALAAHSATVSSVMQRLVLAVLLRIDAGHPAAKAGSYAAWLPPISLVALRCDCRPRWSARAPTPPKSAHRFARPSSRI